MPASRKPRELILPHSTPVPNWIFDHLLGFEDVPGSSFKVLMFLWRRTIGWDKRADYVSLSQITAGTGVGRHQAVKAARLWEDVGLFKRVRAEDRRGMIRFVVDPNISGDEVCMRLGALVREALDARLSLDQLVLRRHQTGATTAPDLVLRWH
jgi:hypothetical protein